MKIDVSRISYKDLERVFSDADYNVREIIHQGGRVILDCVPSIQEQVSIPSLSFA
ncbi:hypothetical protein HUU53_01410 [Candidatus Micrarchaeota archaeon]|nr:hypothetical protein [Candidatus Micrarchaeota archaeon]